MKYTKLETMEIKNPLSNPILKEKRSIGKLLAKVAIAIGATVILTAGAYYFKVHSVQYLDLQNKVMMEQDKANTLQPGVVLDKTAQIISEEGNISISVAKKYAEWIYDASIKYAVDPILIMSIMSVESNFNYLAISPTGPVGLLQIASSYHKEKTTRAALFDPRNNIMVGTQIMKEYSNRSSNVVTMLLMYNGSLGKAPVYATKVLNKKKYYETEIMKAISTS